MKYRAEYSDVCGYWVVLNEEKHFALGGYSKEKAHLKAEELNAKEVIEELYQCPYNEACKCRLDEACLYCETFGEYLNQEAKERVDSVLTNKKTDDEIGELVKEIAYKQHEEEQADDFLTKVWIVKKFLEN